MDRVGVTFLMLLSVALMRVSDSERPDSTGGTDDGASARALVRDRQSTVRSLVLLPKRPEDSVSSTASSRNVNVNETSSASFLSHSARGTPENEPKRSSLQRDSSGSRHAPAIKWVSTHGTDNSSATALRDSARRTARQVVQLPSRHRSRVPNRQNSRHSRRIAGPNVCGSQQCCSGWALAPGTSRCIKPDCQPPCQNRGSCSRPHTCVCRSGFQGARCEEVTPEQVYIRDGGALRRVKPGTNPFQKDQARRRPAERQALDTARPPQTTATRAPLHAASQVRRGPPDSAPQQTGTSRTVKRYPSSTGPITSNALPNGNGYSAGHGTAHGNWPRSRTGNTDGQSPSVPRTGANLTSGLDRIKIVFTPMLCRRVCSGGRCHNSCEKGDTTTVYSENHQRQQQQRQQSEKQGFRLFFCQIPCLNGGRCIGRDHCWCPSNSTGKFCHLPAPPPTRHQGGRKEVHQPGGNAHSMYTLPLSNQQVSLHPSLVNVHVQHPPEAEVQIHQVARVKPGQRPTAPEGAHSVQQRSQPGNGNGDGKGHGNGNGHHHKPTSGHANGDLPTDGNADGTLPTNGNTNRPQNRQNGYVGRCFQETVDGQCGKPLPGLTKQDDCCGSVGASWGLNKCQKCPKTPAYAVIANGQVECPKGYKRMNLTHCQDINECTMTGICKNAECLNTKGSYRCTCKPGFMLDPARSHCVSDKAVSEHKGLCYRSSSAGACSLPLPQTITKQICCCSRVGKAWGAGCERCPVPNSDNFKEICPAGHGYTYSRSDVQISLRQLEEADLSNPDITWLDPSPLYPEWPPYLPEQPYPDQHHHTPQFPVYPETPQVPQHHPQTPPPLPRQPPPIPAEQPMEPSADTLQPAGERPRHPEAIDKCALAPNICGHGTCVPVQTGYTCSCDPGYKLSDLQTNCIDMNECEQNPCEGRGHCVNTFGSYTCHCHSGFSQVITQNRKFCQDINECSMPNKCQDGDCVNTEGSYTCECKTGYAMSLRGLCEDIDECREAESCPGGVCTNTPGSFHCRLCGPGSRPSNGRCADVDECVLPGVCLNGRCVNLEGTHECVCGHGYQATPDSKACGDVDECRSLSACANGICLNSEGSYTCRTCPQGYIVSYDGELCEDIDECALPSTCPRGTCTNTEGSFTCLTCRPGFRVPEDGHQCEDVDECHTEGACPGGVCANTHGSFSCVNCDLGFIPKGGACKDVNECLSVAGICGEGECLNTEGSYMCICSDGYTTGTGATGCQDVDECSPNDICARGQCINTAGSYLCLCEAGFKFNPAISDCEDQDECEEFGRSACGIWRCENLIGSYRCFMGCEPGMDGEDCDAGECANETICGSHGFCEKTDTSYLCQCHQGYTNPPGETTRCVDVNECEMSMAVCGEALCENFDGSFLCICPSDNEEFDPVTSQCRTMAGGIPPPSSPSSPSSPSRAEERKECYYNLNDADMCDNVLSRNATKQECCCTIGAGWGDNCEIHPCPLAERADFIELCPHGIGLLPQTLPASSQSLEERHHYRDVNECEMFGSEICKSGQCSNLFSTYTCFCRSGFYYNHVRLECVDYDECETADTCVHGVCVNTAGSFNCFCSPPLVLDGSGRRCISLNSTEAESLEPEHDIHMDICWQVLMEDNMCADPLAGHRTTYTECCCLYGVAWSEQCAFCPRKDSEDYAVMCNLRRPGVSDSLRERPPAQYEYSPEGSESPLEPFVSPYWDNYGGTLPEGTYYNPGVPQGVPLFTDNDYSPREPAARVPVLRPREYQPRPLRPHAGRFGSFEGLRAEECGILNGCENGRCVRVREGYTCDCFDGYELNLSKMACIDINECEDISDSVALCQNGRCSNTEGSYKCSCLAGFVASAKPHECIPEIPQEVASEAG
ncbi:unnamed protein product [Lota lota]